MALADKRILIVEDDMLLSMVEERLIKKLGFKQVEKATSGSEAIEKNRDFKPDLIVMDIILNGEMDGIQVMEEIRTSSDVPVIYLSGNSDRFNYERAKKTGFTDYLVKPITKDDLLMPFGKVFGNGNFGSAQNGSLKKNKFSNRRIANVN